MDFTSLFVKNEGVHFGCLKKVRSDRSKYSSFNPRCLASYERLSNVGTVRNLRFVHREFTSAGRGFVKSKITKTTKEKNIFCNLGYRKVKQINSKIYKESYVPNLNSKLREAPIYLGNYPKKIGVIPGFVNFPPSCSSDFFSSEDCPARYRQKIGIDRVNASGSFDSNQSSVAQFGAINKQRITFENIRNATFRLFKKYNFTCCNKPRQLDYDVIRIREKSGCGGDLQGIFANKRKAFPTAFKIAMELKSKIIRNKRFTPNLSIYTLGGRDKRSKTLKGDGAQINSRHVIQQDMVEYILAKPFSDYAEKALASDYNFPVFLKHSNAKLGYIKILHQMSRYDKTCVEADWSLYDTTLIRKAIIGAFSIVRALFPKSKDIDKMFFYFLSGYLHKHVLMPDGKLFRFSKGAPSGSVWTTIINGIANLILLEHTVDLYINNNSLKCGFKVMVAGDDTVILFNKFITFGKTQFEKLTKQETGMNIEISNIGKFANKDEDRAVSFLKTSFWINTDDDSYYVTTRGEDVAKRLACPQKHLKTPKKLLDYFKAQYDLIFNSPLSLSVIKGWMQYAGLELCPDVYGENLTILPEINQLQIARKFFEIYKPCKFPEFKRKQDTDTIIPFYELKEDEWKVDFSVVDNWLYDNTIFDWGGKIDFNSRYSWFYRQSGRMDDYLYLLEVATKQRYQKIDFTLLFKDFKLWRLIKAVRDLNNKMKNIYFRV